MDALPIDAFLHPIGFAVFAGWWLATLYCVSVCQRHPNIPAEWRPWCNLVVLINGPWGLGVLLLRYRYPATERAVREYHDQVKGGPLERRLMKAVGVRREVPEESSIELADGAGNILTPAQLGQGGQAGQGLVQTRILMLDTLESGAGVLGLEPQRAGGYAVHLELDGRMHPVQTLPSDLGQKVITCLKIAAGLNIAERRREQAGPFTIRLPGHVLRCHLSTRGTLHGPQAAVRVHDSSRRPVPLASLGLRSSDVERLLELLPQRGRIILASGPPGSGRTTSLYALLTQFDPQHTALATIEEHTAYEVEHATQTEVATGAQIGYATILQSMVRKEPEVILVGEVRDAETMDLAVQAAAAGQLILTTLEARDGAAAIMRLRGMGVQTRRVGQSVAAIIAQRLPRVLCPQCKQPAKLEAGPWAEAQQLGLTSQRVWRAVGCPQCRETGYRGRTGVFEVMVLTPQIAEGLERDPSIQELRRTAAAAGMQPLLQHAMELVSAGVTSFEEIQRVCTQE